MTTITTPTRDAPRPVGGGHGGPLRSVELFAGGGGLLIGSVTGGENMALFPDGAVRYFTVRESARLQTFPDRWELHGAWSEAMRQLGNAVPTVLAEQVFGSVAEQLRLASARAELGRAVAQRL